MKANYTAYTYKDMGTWTDCEIREKGEAELPSDGHGIRYQLRKLFPGFEFNKTNCTNHRVTCLFFMRFLRPRSEAKRPAEAAQ